MEDHRGILVAIAGVGVQPGQRLGNGGKRQALGAWQHQVQRGEELLELDRKLGVQAVVGEQLNARSMSASISLAVST